MFAIDNNKKTCYNYTKLKRFCVIGKGIADYFFCKGTAQPYLRSPCKKAESSRMVKFNKPGILPGLIVALSGGNAAAPLRP